MQVGSCGADYDYHGVGAMQLLMLHYFLVPHVPFVSCDISSATVASSRKHSLIRRDATHSASIRVGLYGCMPVTARATFGLFPMCVSMYSSETRVHFDRRGIPPETGMCKSLFARDCA